MLMNFVVGFIMGMVGVIAFRLLVRVIAGFFRGLQEKRRLRRLAERSQVEDSRRSESLVASEWAEAVEKRMRFLRENTSDGRRGFPRKRA